MCGLGASIFFSIEALFIRYLDQKGVPGNISAFCYLLFEGCIGTCCLIVYTCFGHGLLELTLGHFFLTALSGILITTGLVVFHLSINSGISSVCFSIVSLQSALQMMVG
jgi:drug/metabolite transporter (DMT)-like permease